MPELGVSRYRYWAFISYSSRDRSWARWLHRAIETYGIPARLVNHPTPAGESAPRRFHPLFHDRAELPASSDLGAQIEEALRASRYLIVVCSPHAAQSKWVNKEIETFLSLGRSGRVLAIIVDGEPNAGDERECFPPALREAEPTAADARPEGDGKGNAKLKLLAGMLGVGFDGLKHRDTLRRIRRLEVAFFAALVLTFVFAGLAVHAQRERNKAAKAWLQAQSIMEYLLFDVRYKLVPEARASLSQAEAFYRMVHALRKGEGDFIDERDHADSLNNMGDSLRGRGDFEGAVRVYEESLAIVERFEPDPRDAFWQTSAFVSHRGIANALLDGGDPTGALHRYRECLRIIECLASCDSSNIDRKKQLCTCCLEIAHVMEVQGDLADALREYEHSLTITKRITSLDPRNVEWQRNLLFIYCRTAVIAEVAEQSDARTWYRKAYEQLKAMRAQGMMEAADEKLLAGLKEKVATSTKSPR